MSPKIGHRCPPQGGLRELALSPHGTIAEPLRPVRPNVTKTPLSLQWLFKAVSLGPVCKKCRDDCSLQNEAHRGGTQLSSPHGTRSPEAGPAEAASCLGRAESRWSRAGTVRTSDGAEEGQGGGSAWPRQRVREHTCPSEEPDPHYDAQERTRYVSLTGDRPESRGLVCQIADGAKPGVHHPKFYVCQAGSAHAGWDTNKREGKEGVHVDKRRQHFRARKLRQNWPQ